MKRTRTLPIGSISTGTLRMEDLIPALLWELERIRLSRPHRRGVQSIRKASDVDGYFESTEHDCMEDYQELCDIAECYVPDYCYFGAHEGDGADVGVWPTIPEDDDYNVYRSSYQPGESAIQDRDVNTVDTDGRRRYTHYLHVNDHGNATLYRRAGNRWVEVWSVV